MVSSGPHLGHDIDTEGLNYTEQRPISLGWAIPHFFAGQSRARFYVGVSRRSVGFALGLVGSL
jgi:hypothetical protein